MALDLTPSHLFSSPFPSLSIRGGAGSVSGVCSLNCGGCGNADSSALYLWQYPVLPGKGSPNNVVTLGSFLHISQIAVLSTATDHLAYIA